MIPSLAAGIGFDWPLEGQNWAAGIGLFRRVFAVSRGVSVARLRGVVFVLKGLGNWNWVRLAKSGFLGTCGFEGASRCSARVDLWAGASGGPQLFRVVPAGVCASVGSLDGRWGGCFRSFW